MATLEEIVQAIRQMRKDQTFLDDVSLNNAPRLTSEQWVALYDVLDMDKPIRQLEQAFLPPEAEAKMNEGSMES